jgi:hypothetical protein
MSDIERVSIINNIARAEVCEHCAEEMVEFMEEVVGEAADENERLRAALRTILEVAVQVDVLQQTRLKTIVLAARAALGGRDE